MPTRITLEQQLHGLVGLQLLHSHRVADMRMFHFGMDNAHTVPSTGHYALHVQCAWRIEGLDAIITGRSDLWEPCDTDTTPDWDTWDYDTDANLQDDLLARWLEAATEPRLVVQVTADAYGGFTIQFAPHDRLHLFPAGARGEDWRLFQPGTTAAHLVLVGGKRDVDA